MISKKVEWSDKEGYMMVSFPSCMGDRKMYWTLHCALCWLPGSCNSGQFCLNGYPLCAGWTWLEAELWLLILSQGTGWFSGHGDDGFNGWIRWSQWSFPSLRILWVYGKWNTEEKKGAGIYSCSTGLCPRKYSSLGTTSLVSHSRSLKKHTGSLWLGCVIKNFMDETEKFWSWYECAMLSKRKNRKPLEWTRQGVTVNISKMAMITGFMQNTGLHSCAHSSQE